MAYTKSEGKVTIECDKCHTTQTEPDNGATGKTFVNSGWGVNPNAKKYYHLCENCQPKKHRDAHRFVAKKFGHLLTIIMLFIAFMGSAQNKIDSVGVIEASTFSAISSGWNSSPDLNYKSDTSFIYYISESSDSTEVGRIKIHGDTIDAIRQVIDLYLAVKEKEYLTRLVVLAASDVISGINLDYIYGPNSFMKDEKWKREGRKDLQYYRKCLNRWMNESSKYELFEEKYERARQQYKSLSR